ADTHEVLGPRAVPARDDARRARPLRHRGGVAVEVVLAPLLLDLPDPADLELAVVIGVDRRLSLVEQLLDLLVRIALRIEPLHVALEALVPDLVRIIDLGRSGEHILDQERIAQKADERALLLE